MTKILNLAAIKARCPNATVSGGEAASGVSDGLTGDGTGGVIATPETLTGEGRQALRNLLLANDTEWTQLDLNVVMDHETLEIVLEGLKYNGFITEIKFNTLSTQQQNEILLTWQHFNPFLSRFSVGRLEDRDTESVKAPKSKRAISPSLRPKEFIPLSETLIVRNQRIQLGMLKAILVSDVINFKDLSQELFSHFQDLDQDKQQNFPVVVRGILLLLRVSLQSLEQRVIEEQRNITPAEREFALRIRLLTDKMVNQCRKIKSLLPRDQDLTLEKSEILSLAQDIARKVLSLHQRGTVLDVSNFLLWLSNAEREKIEDYLPGVNQYFSGESAVGQKGVQLTPAVCACLTTWLTENHSEINSLDFRDIILTDDLLDALKEGLIQNKTISCIALPKEDLVRKKFIQILGPTLKENNIMLLSANIIPDTENHTIPVRSFPIDYRGQCMPVERQLLTYVEEELPKRLEGRPDNALKPIGAEIRRLAKGVELNTQRFIQEFLAIITPKNVESFTVEHCQAIFIALAFIKKRAELIYNDFERVNLFGTIDDIRKLIEPKNSGQFSAEEFSKLVDSIGNDIIGAEIIAGLLFHLFLKNSYEFVENKNRRTGFSAIGGLFEGAPKFLVLLHELFGKFNIVGDNFRLYDSSLEEMQHTRQIINEQLQKSSYQNIIISCLKQYYNFVNRNEEFHLVLSGINLGLSGFKDVHVQQEEFLKLQLSDDILAIPDVATVSANINTAWHQLQMQQGLQTLNAAMAASSPSSAHCLKLVGIRLSLVHDRLIRGVSQSVFEADKTINAEHLTVSDECMVIDLEDSSVKIVHDVLARNEQIQAMFAIFKQYLNEWNIEELDNYLLKLEKIFFSSENLVLNKTLKLMFYQQILDMLLIQLNELYSQAQTRSLTDPETLFVQRMKDRWLQRIDSDMKALQPDAPGQTNSYVFQHSCVVRHIQASGLPFLQTIVTTLNNFIDLTSGWLSSLKKEDSQAIYRLLQIIQLRAKALGKERDFEPGILARLQKTYPKEFSDPQKIELTTILTHDVLLGFMISLCIEATQSRWKIAEDLHSFLVSEKIDIKTANLEERREIKRLMCAFEQFNEREQLEYKLQNSLPHMNWPNPIEASFSRPTIAELPKHPIRPVELPFPRYPSKLEALPASPLLPPPIRRASMAALNLLSSPLSSSDREPRVLASSLMSGGFDEVSLLRDDEDNEGLRCNSDSDLEEETGTLVTPMSFATPMSNYDQVFLTVQQRTGIDQLRNLVSQFLINGAESMDSSFDSAPPTPMLPNQFLQSPLRAVFSVGRGNVISKLHEIQEKERNQVLAIQFTEGNFIQSVRQLIEIVATVNRRLSVSDRSVSRRESVSDRRFVSLSNLIQRLARSCSAEIDHTEMMRELMGMAMQLRKQILEEIDRKHQREWEKQTKGILENPVELVLDAKDPDMQELTVVLQRLKRRLASDRSIVRIRCILASYTPPLYGDGSSEKEKAILNRVRNDNRNIISVLRKACAIVLQNNVTVRNITIETPCYSYVFSREGISFCEGSIVRQIQKDDGDLRTRLDFSAETAEKMQGCIEDNVAFSRNLINLIGHFRQGLYRVRQMINVAAGIHEKYIRRRSVPWGSYDLLDFVLSNNMRNVWENALHQAKFFNELYAALKKRFKKDKREGEVILRIVKWMQAIVKKWKEEEYIEGARIVDPNAGSQMRELQNFERDLTKWLSKRENDINLSENYGISFVQFLFQEILKLELEVSQYPDQKEELSSDFSKALQPVMQEFLAIQLNSPEHRRLWHAYFQRKNLEELRLLWRNKINDHRFIRFCWQRILEYLKTKPDNKDRYIAAFAVMRKIRELVSIQVKNPQTFADWQQLNTDILTEWAALKNLVKGIKVGEKLMVQNIIDDLRIDEVNTELAILPRDYEVDFIVCLSQQRTFTKSSHEEKKKDRLGFGRDKCGLEKALDRCLWELDILDVESGMWAAYFREHFAELWQPYSPEPTWYEGSVEEGMSRSVSMMSAVPRTPFSPRMTEMPRSRTLTGGRAPMLSELMGEHSGGSDDHRPSNGGSF